MIFVPKCHHLDMKLIVSFDSHCCIIWSNRLGYEIEGRVGFSDCFCPTVCYPCAVTQLLNEVASRGPKIVSATSGPWLAEKKDYSALGDPCDFLCTFLTCKCEMANVFSQLAGVPFWFALCSNFCQVCVTLSSQFVSSEIDDVAINMWLNNLKKPASLVTGYPM